MALCVQNVSGTRSAPGLQSAPEGGPVTAQQLWKTRGPHIHFSGGPSCLLCGALASPPLTRLCQMAVEKHLNLGLVRLGNSPDSRGLGEAPPPLSPDWFSSTSLSAVSVASSFSLFPPTPRVYSDPPQGWSTVGLNCENQGIKFPEHRWTLVLSLSERLLRLPAPSGVPWSSLAAHASPVIPEFSQGALYRGTLWPHFPVLLSHPDAPAINPAS